jgi:hypothetical protein
MNVAVTKQSEMLLSGSLGAPIGYQLVYIAILPLAGNLCGQNND